MVVVVLAGFLTVVPAGGRVGGLLRLLPARAVVPVDVLAAAVVAVVPSRRTVDGVVLGRFAAVELATLVADAGDFVVVLGVVLDDSVPASPVPAVPVVSSPERIESSGWTTSNPSTSDMVPTDGAVCEGRYRCVLIPIMRLRIVNDTIIVLPH
jgi:hypothetical protein